MISRTGYKRSDAGKVGQKNTIFVCHMAAAALRFCMRKLMIPKDWDNKTYNHNNHNKYLIIGNMYITSIKKKSNSVALFVVSVCPYSK